MGNPGQVAEEIERTRRRTERRVGVELDRRKGKRPLVVERIGDLVLFWATTGMIVSGATTTIYLTDTSLPNGKNLFLRKPMVNVSRNEILGSGVGMVRATNPIADNQPYRVRTNLAWNMYWEVFWDQVHFVWGVVVSNSVGVTQDFLVEGWGV